MIRVTKSDLTRLLMAMGLGLTLSGCFVNKDLPPLEVGEIDLGHPEKDRPPVSGNTLDQFNSLNKYAPYAVNINVSYEFSLLATNIDEDVDDHFWMFKGRMKDNQHTYTQVYLIVEQEGYQRHPGSVVTQGRKRVTGYETCVRLGNELDATNAALFAQSVSDYAAYVNEPKGDIYIRRFVANYIEDDGRRLETAFFVDLDAIDMSCSDYDMMRSASDENRVSLDRWRDEALRAFEIIG